ncbi:autoinducer binding domain-containing protein [Tropicimonas isoalkanivorans]|uniref:LuxR family transcriptional regulator n=1 Tax=Tropicimonas isoalkanivorans TaxID=441112 RepID=A0A1I1MVH1_9RHOB|nr:autoinducer binding domain-containing protein [Tropicimonas isoalkanivorans]SFC87218.1 LuxR family transcriptional regulator [Tropicimonas isoalkanivorans]
MNHTREVHDILAEMQGLCTAGFAVALHVIFTTPRFLFQTYDPVWAKVYSEKGLVMRDPTVKWALQNDGMIDWQDLEDDDPAEVIRQAREHGIEYGFAASVCQNDSRSIGSFTSKDGAFSEEVKQSLMTLFRRLHEITNVDEDTEDTLSDLLKRLSVELTHAWQK